MSWFPLWFADRADVRSCYRVRGSLLVGVEYDEAVVKLQDITQTLILESIDEATFRAMPYTCPSRLVLMGMIHERWASEKTPKVMNHGAEMLILHSIEPYTPKRPRE